MLFISGLFRRVFALMKKRTMLLHNSVKDPNSFVYIETRTDNNGKTDFKTDIINKE